MGKIKRGGYIFITFIGDYSPAHVHILRDDKLICKWNLEENVVLEGTCSGRLRRLVLQLVEEGCFEN